MLKLDDAAMLIFNDAQHLYGSVKLTALSQFRW